MPRRRRDVSIAETVEGGCQNDVGPGDGRAGRVHHGPGELLRLRERVLAEVVAFARVPDSVEEHRHGAGTFHLDTERLFLSGLRRGNGQRKRAVRPGRCPRERRWLRAAPGLAFREVERSLVGKSRNRCSGGWLLADQKPALDLTGMRRQGRKREERKRRQRDSNGLFHVRTSAPN